MKHRCGNCKHSDNDLGIVALHCDLVNGENSKVRTWEDCMFKCEQWERGINKMPTKINIKRS